ncbi:Pentatricopeptide repeat superfamily protein [Gossypium australe]|uniref:Pentatricopeptide repeat superfamily protein n=1 Tax=Gossypium australe TaxID=47621 RepID=A0A5B6VXY0_9ROSI|nr:Pentatricopeptide repeat superfamily protein [Gossypium australe]
MSSISSSSNLTHYQRSLFSFLNFLFSQPMFRHTLHSYSAMSHLLIAHNMFPQARFLLNFVVSCKGKGSACSIWALVLETKGTHHCNFVFDSLMIVYTDLGFVSDVIQCFGLVRNHKLRVPFRGCQYLLDRMMKISYPIV